MYTTSASSIVSDESVKWQLTCTFCIDLVVQGYHDYQSNLLADGHFVNEKQEIHMI